MKIVAVVHEAEEGGFWAEVPVLPGCVTEADTWSELEANLIDAVTLYLKPDPTLIEDKFNKTLEINI